MKAVRKFCILFLLASVLFSATGIASASDIVPTFTSKFLSQYVGVNGAVFYDKPVVQSDLFVLLPRGFYIDLWWSTGLNSSFSHDLDDEIDITAGWSGPIGNGILLDVGVIFIDTAKLFSGKGIVGDFFEPYAQIEKTFTLSAAHSLTPYLRLEVMLPLRADVSSGVYAHLGLRHAWTITDFLTLNQKVIGVYDSGVAGFEPALIGRYQGSLDWKLSKKISLSAPLLQLSRPLTPVSDTDGRRFHAVYGLSLTFQF